MENSEALQNGIVIPAHPLALNASRKLDERRQRALTRYYVDAGAGGLAVGVHTTQFHIRDPRFGLYEPVLALVTEEMNRCNAQNQSPLVRVAGICGDTKQAVAEAQIASDLGYQYGLLNLGALAERSIPSLIDHCKSIAETITLFGFYLQSAVGGIELPFAFWRMFCEIENVAAIKIAAFNRYQTLDVVRAVHESGRADIALYTGNDDNIVLDLLTRFRFFEDSNDAGCSFAGGLLGQWAVWTSRATELLSRCHEESGNEVVSRELITIASQLTDANAAIFDAAYNFRGCIPGIHEILRRQGLLEGTWCLDETEQLSNGQAKELDRIITAYPSLVDDEFVKANLDRWLAG